MNKLLNCQMCGHEQRVDEARNSEIFDVCDHCGARILHQPKDTPLVRAEKELAKYRELQW